MEAHGSTVLLIDDNPEYLNIVESTIRDAEPTLQIVKAYTGKQALDVLRDHNLDLIISDVTLSDMDGYELCSEVKKDPKLRIIPLLFVTGSDDDNATKIKLLEAGAEAFLAKPFGRSELIAQIKALLRLKAAEDRIRHERDLLKHQMLEKDRDLVEERERISLILDHIIEGIWDWNLKTGTIFISNKCKQLLGYRDDELTDDSIEAFFELICPLDRDRFRKEVDDYLSQLHPEFKSEVRMCYRDGSYRWFLFRGYAVWDNESQPLRILGIQSDITESKEALQTLQQVALYDYVTMLPNRILFYKLTEKEMLASRRGEGKVGFLFIDLDDFKPVNDEYGHHTGDLLLAAIGKQFVEHLRPLDIVARFGGDEFIISLPEVKTGKEIEGVIRRLRRDMSAPIIINEKEFYANFSAGYSLYPDDGDNIDTLLDVADKKMYEDKEHRKGGRRR